MYELEARNQDGSIAIRSLPLREFQGMWASGKRRRALQIISRYNRAVKIEWRGLVQKYRQVHADRRWMLRVLPETRAQLISASGWIQAFTRSPLKCVYCGAKQGNYAAFLNRHTAEVQKQRIRDHLEECPDAPWNEEIERLRTALEEVIASDDSTAADDIARDALDGR